MKSHRLYDTIKRSDVKSGLVDCSHEVSDMFKKKSEKKPYDKMNKKAVLRCSICTGEQVAGFKDLDTGHFDEIMLIRDSKDLDEFMDTYDVAAITKEY